ncbi:hypothetical protein BD324DRAFT_526478 [Kockovaella imperatae]|uniref:Uncharacterized protein n=1 Tax=Kockovaella imperatae TaxID=4999 RepID=A0A1Y1UDM7_9TREE|nr:hypothetical protein BD324DRAFT_526478 [Kockovaella imperatae]ORX36141.1 hypothetical protein BD324DRAFT_526478 [Kockovaella imperatae]
MPVASPGPMGSDHPSAICLPLLVLPISPPNGTPYDRPARPRLRIVTAQGSTPPPQIVKTAPIIVSNDPTLSFTFPSKSSVASLAHEDTASYTLLSPPKPTSRSARLKRPAHVGHARKLSDKFKSLFSALHIKRDDRIPFFQPGMVSTDILNDCEYLTPLRPHPSPGTASFLVSRHLAPDPNLPTSAHSSSTAFSIASRPTFASKYRATYDSHGAISHFSNPTTLSSAASSMGGRSVSSSVILDKSPGLGKRMALDEGVRLNARIRRCRSLPDMRL